METAAHPHSYQAFILRCWAERGLDEMPAWRFSLEPVSGGKRLGFCDLKTLVSFLEQQTNRKGDEIGI